MMELKIQIEFANLYSKFYNEEHTPSDVGELIKILRYNKRFISDTAAQLLLQIPLCVLENQVELKNADNWASTNGSYFASNHRQEPFHSIFAKQNFDLETMVNCLKEIISDYSKLNSDFHLRNPEVTLCNDVSVKECSNFKESGKLFARIMDKAFDC